MVIGDQFGSPNFASDGSIDDFLIFDYVLTTNEINQVYEWRE
jgi:hypothetical protein